MAEGEVILPLDTVIRLWEINPRGNYINESRVASMMENLSALPPMVVFDVPGRGLLLSSGFHRFDAHKKAGATEARFYIRQGTLHDAEDFAILDNLGPLSLTPEQRREAIQNWLTRHPEHSNEKIAFNLQAKRVGRQ